MQIVQIDAQTRATTGKREAKKLRAEGSVPAIIYGGDENTSIIVNAKEVKPLVYTPDFKLAEISVDGGTHKCILKDIDFHPLTDEIVHIDFLRVIENTPIKVELPLGFKGKSPGVKAGGKLIQQVRKIKVKTVPEKMVDKLFVDISKLELGASVRVKDVITPEGMDIMMPEATPVAIVEVPRALKSAAAAEAKAAAGAPK